MFTSQTRKATYDTNGVVASFAVPFVVYDVAHIKVALSDPATGAVVSWTNGQHYTLSGDHTKGEATLTAVAAPANARRLSIWRELPFVQTLRIPPYEGLAPYALERTLDEIVFRQLQAADLSLRSLRLRTDDDGAVPELPLPAARADKFLKFGANGEATAVSVVVAGELDVSDFTETLLDLADAAAWRAAIGAAALDAANVWTQSQTTRSTDAGAGAGPDDDLDRASPSPAASDALGRRRYRGRDAGGAAVDYAETAAEIEQPTNAAASGRFLVRVLRAGVKTLVGWFGAGFVVGAPTGGDKGPGSVNAVAYFKNGEPLDAAATPRVANVGAGQPVFKEVADGEIKLRSITVQNATSGGSIGPVQNVSLSVALDGDSLRITLTKELSTP